MHIRAAFALCFAIALRSAATVIVFPTFSQPEVIGDALVALSPAGDRVVCIGKDGAKRWERRGRHLVGFHALDDSSLYVQDGRSVLRIDVASGRATSLTRMPRHEAIVIDHRADAAWSVSTDFARRLFVFRDPRTFAPLWRDDRVDSVEEVAGDRVLVVATDHVDAGNGGYSFANAALRALERRTGRELWSLPLRQQMPEVRLAVIGRTAVFADGPPNTLLRAVDIDSGKVVAERDSETFFVEADGDGALTIENGDALRRLRVPSLDVIESMPIPAQENLFFFRRGSVIVTSGIYSIAAFDIASKAKLWEIRNQRLLSHPDDRFIYASYSDDERKRGVIEKIDLRTGAETPLYDEPLPPEEPVDRRRVRKIERERKRQQERKRREEAKRLLPIGPELCFRSDKSSLGDIRESLRLQPDGTFEYVNADPNFAPFRMTGRWMKRGDLYELSGSDLVRDIEAERLHVDVSVNANVPLVADLRDVVHDFLQTHAQAEFTRDELSRLRVVARGCPAEAAAYCDADGNRSIGVFDFDMGSPHVSRQRVDDLLAALNDYVASTDNDVLRFRIETYRSYRFTLWIDPHAFWSCDAARVRSDIDSVLDDHSPLEPVTFRLVPCVATAAR